MEVKEINVKTRAGDRLVKAEFVSPHICIHKPLDSLFDGYYGITHYPSGFSFASLYRREPLKRDQAIRYAQKIFEFIGDIAENDGMKARDAMLAKEPKLVEKMRAIFDEEAAL